MVQEQGKKSRLALCLLSLHLLAGCAANHIWVHPDHPGSSVELDYLFCETNTRNEAKRSQVQPPVVNLTGLANVIRMINEATLDREYESQVQRLIGECLKKKGWRLKETR